MDATLLQPTRIQALSYLSSTDLHTFLKRDDECGYAVSAGKLRKYASLIPALQQQGTQTAAIIGGLNSNNLVGLAQHLLQAGIRPIPFVPHSPDTTLGHNHFLLRLLIPLEDWIHIPRDQWIHVEAHAATWLQEQTHQNRIAAIIPEGCWMPEALPGAQTLALDILRNGIEAQLDWNHILMEAGTGLTAIGLLLGWPADAPPVCVHILLLADSEERFLQRLDQALTWDPNARRPILGQDFKLYHLQNAKSFGSINQTLLRGIVQLARTQGLLTDPIYSAKLLQESHHIIQAQHLQGNLLIIHSGGLQTLIGFQDKLLPLL